MGFPTWTLWGMGLSAFAALLAIALAFVALSPRMLARLNMANRRLDMRARTFTGYGLALLLLAMGFFVAGVPLGEEARAAGRGHTLPPPTPATGPSPPRRPSRPRWPPAASPGQ